MVLLPGGDCGYRTLFGSLEHIRRVKQCVMPSVSYPAWSKPAYALALVRLEVELAVIRRRRQVGVADRHTGAKGEARSSGRLLLFRKLRLKAMQVGRCALRVGCSLEDRPFVFGEHR